jgi:O-antigen biosynthesis protein
MEDLTSIVIPIRNLDYANAHYTGNCIGSIRYFTHLPYEIIIVDNASTVELSSKDEPFIKAIDKYIKNDTNMGVSVAWNQGIGMAEGKYICFMNSDVEVYDDWLDFMIASINSGDCDVIMATPMYAYPYGRAKKALEIRKDELSEFCDFSCFLTKKEIFDKVGLFDENIKLGWGEDVIFKHKLEKLGLKIRSTKMVNTHHIGMATGFSMMNHGELVNEAMDKNREYIKKTYNL